MEFTTFKGESSEPSCHVPQTLLYSYRRPREVAKVIAHHRPSNLPGKSVVVMLVTQAPNAASPPNTHGGVAVVGLTLSSEMLNQMNADPSFLVRPGETWFEGPGCHHVRGEDASDAFSASFYVVFVVDDDIIKDGYKSLLIVD